MSYKNSGFTLLELMIAVGVIVIALSGLLAVFSHLMSINENAKNLTLAVTACQDKLEQMRNSNFSTLYSTYNAAHFDPNGFRAADAEGAISITNTDPALLEVHVSVSWRTRSNMVIGEDKNLNGILDSGEDLAPANGKLDSPAEIITLMCQR
jgi:prepilin-type N-terminal cleavage/methylation domain-containing protein